MDKREVLRRLGWLMNVYKQEDADLEKDLEKASEKGKDYLHGVQDGVRWCQFYLDVLCQNLIAGMDEKVEPIDELVDFCKRQMEEKH